MTMEPREDLKKKLEDKKLQLKSNSRDARFAEKLIDDMLSLKGQIDIEPTRVYIPEKNVLDEYDGGSYRIVKTTNEIIFHVKGGYKLIVSPNYTSLYGMLADIVDNIEEYEKLEGEEKEQHELTCAALAYLLEMPLYVFSDPEFMFKMATECAKFLQDQTEKALNEDLQPEDEEANAGFREIVDLAVEAEKENNNRD